MPRRSAVAALLIAAAFLLALSPSSAPARAPGARHDRLEREVVSQLNQVRARHALPRLRRSLPLAAAADGHSADMLRGNFFAHASSDGTSFAQRLGRYVKARRVGETLGWLAARSDGSYARALVKLWMASPSHRAVLLTRGYRRVGVGQRPGGPGDPRGVLVTADFASRR